MMFVHKISGFQRLLAAIALQCVAAAAFAQTAQNADLQDINRILKSGQAQQALDRVNTYLTSKPKDPVGRFIRGLAQAELGKTNDAIMTFQSLTEDYPELPEPYNNLAVLYSSKGQFEKARVALELAIQTPPSYSTAHENLGDIYAKLASQAYDKALQLDKSNPNVATKLNLVRDLFSTNPKANTAPRVTASAAALATTPPPVAISSVTSPAAATRPGAAAPAQVAAAAPAKTVPSVAAPVSVPPAPAKAEPAKAEPPKMTPAADGSAEVLAAVNAWASSWSSKNASGYLAAYSKDFKPDDGTSRTAWAAARRERITTPKRITVEVLGATVEMESPTQARVTFRQAYSSDALKTRSRKTLTLTKEGPGWLITRERVG
jgi:tetratricopeptide (TPR) repeat protein